jgi:hypothetical protein
MRRTPRKKNQLVKRIIDIEIIGFLSAILIIWMLAVVIIILTYDILKRLTYLEGILPVCSFCNKIRFKERWVPIEDYVSEHSGADFSHSVCPECAEANYGEIMEMSKKK